MIYANQLGRDDEASLDDGFAQNPAYLNIALKEWSATIHALTTGDQIFLIRKGGIREPNRRFELQHNRFLLYPTRFHEARQMLKPQYRHLAGADEAHIEGTIQLKIWAETVDVLKIDEAKDLSALFESHVWTEEFVDKRIAWKPRHAADLILLKAYVLDNPVNLPVAPHHLGCKSWVELDPAIALGTYSPAIPDDLWEKRANEVKTALSQTLTHHTETP